MKKILIILILIFLAQTSHAEVETLKLKSGRIVQGEIIRVNDEHIVIVEKGVQYKITYNLLAPDSKYYKPSKKELEIESLKKNHKYIEVIYETPDVEAYLVDWCPYCRKMEAFLKANSISYTRLNPEKDPSARQKFSTLGCRGYPALKVRSQVVCGYNPQAVLKALRK